ncbi:hypothetical protein [Sulfurimonas sp.]|jgi:hypothetical protein|uniref:hypothetical protein n=1 Tax=Sulfurimonas sp. TaxID=2022749 RepID=UPI0025FD71D2|nr:hypothetical protein [Sulfurimonas sp.]MCK9472179.1 hypothetical protein [Sulfurimonas sp.]MDD3505665.1 hypothetical protein [Sulfurimonas sp.]
MLYIVTALKPEAQAFVEKYRLTKAKCGKFTLFSAKELRVILSGVGTDNAKEATDALIKNFNPSKDDIFVNIGICGASKIYKIGELIKVSHVIYKDKKHIISNNILSTLTCKDTEVFRSLDDIVDMESYGFCEATSCLKNRYIYKVVSDHFQPSRVTKDETKKLISDVIDYVIKEVKN